MSCKSTSGGRDAGSCSEYGYLVPIEVSPRTVPWTSVKKEYVRMRTSGTQRAKIVSSNKNVHTRHAQYFSHFSEVLNQLCKNKT